MQKSAAVCFSAPSSQVKSTCMEVVMDKMYKCTIKSGAHTPCTEYIHNLCHYCVLRLYTCTQGANAVDTRGEGRGVGHIHDWSKKLLL